MNSSVRTLERTTSGSALYRNIILGLFEKMPYGHLALTLPEGETVVFGNGEYAIKANITITNNNFFKKCILSGDVGFGESYVDGDWETDNIIDVIKWFLINIEYAPSVSGSKANVFFLNILKQWNRIQHVFKSNSLEGSRKNISAHYDLNNDFFALFLDPSMTYSSGIFPTADTTLEQSQVNKYKRLCEQLNLKNTDHVLEIGSGWGGNAIYIAQHYGCKVTTVTISQEQYNFAQKRIAEQGLQDRVEVKLTDYRDLEGSFDKIVSIEMLEAVGHNYLDVYFKKCNTLLKKNGLLALQVITCPDSRYDSFRKGVDWIQKHIFPGSLLPSVAAINKAINSTSDFTMVNLHEMGLDYAKTLEHWYERFNKNKQAVLNLGFDETFIRKWNYYLHYCQAAFEMRNIYVMQLVYSRPNNTGI